MTRMTDFCDLACDLCFNWVPGTVESTAETRKILKRDGWSVVRTTSRLEDHCPLCNGNDPTYWDKMRLRG